MTIEEHHCRHIYYDVLNTTHKQLRTRFDKNQPGVKLYHGLEFTLLKKIVSDVTKNYPELSYQELETQLGMFKSNNTYSCMNEHNKCFQSIIPEERMLYHVETLVMLLLICPMLSCSAERSFSALRRLKTWLRSSMGQIRLNSIAICHTHRHSGHNRHKQHSCRIF